MFVCMNKDTKILLIGMAFMVLITVAAVVVLSITLKPTPDNTVLKQIIAQDSIKMIDLQQSVSNLLSQVEARESELDSLKNTHTTNFNDYRNETIRVRNLPMSERISRIAAELNSPDTIGWR